jgi:hypothetical protein
MKKFLLTLIAIFIFCNGFASSKIFVFHINGVNTTLKDALENAKKLEETANVSSNMLSNGGHFDLLYNKEDESAFCSVCSQLADVFKQKAQEHKDVTVDDYVVAYMKAYNLHYESDSGDYFILKQGIKDDYLKDSAFVGANLEDIYNQFQSKIQQDIKFKYVKEFLTNSMESGTGQPFVLLLPHSQGNLYANELYDYSTQTLFLSADHINIFGIASPASKISGVDMPTSFFYITADNDFVINGLRVFCSIPPFTLSPLDSNTHLDECNDDDLCHSLTDAYLVDKNSNQEIKDTLNNWLIWIKKELIIDGLNSGQISFAFNFTNLSLTESMNVAIYSKGNIIYNLANQAVYHDNFYYLSTESKYTENEDILIADVTKYPLGSYQVLSLDNKNKYINGNIANIWMDVYAKNGHYIFYYPWCSGIFSCELQDGKTEDDFTSTKGNYLRAVSKQLKMSTDVEKNDFSGKLPEAYQNGKLIYINYIFN